MLGHTKSPAVKSEQQSYPSVPYANFEWNCRHAARDDDDDDDDDDADDDDEDGDEDDVSLLLFMTLPRRDHATDVSRARRDGPSSRHRQREEFRRQKASDNLMDQH